jgi:hypothetical protein
MQLCEQQIEDSAVRRNNRVLRRLTSLLRQRVQNGKVYADELFFQLCATNPAAEQAIRTIWQEGGFQPPCGPDDYDEIVDTCIRALKAYREAASGPAVCESAT